MIWGGERKEMFHGDETSMHSSNTFETGRHSRWGGKFRRAWTRARAPPPQSFAPSFSLSRHSSSSCAVAEIQSRAARAERHSSSSPGMDPMQVLSVTAAIATTRPPSPPTAAARPRRMLGHRYPASRTVFYGGASSPIAASRLSPEPHRVHSGFSSTTWSGPRNYERSGMPRGASTDSYDGFDIGRMRRLLCRLGDPHTHFPGEVSQMASLELVLLSESKDVVAELMCL
jgi:hypothetical protein